MAEPFSMVSTPTPERVSVWYFSFTDETRPEGSQFLGALVAQGATMTEAYVSIGLSGLNPGGAALIVGPFEASRDWLARYSGRLLDREEAENMADPDGQ